MTQGDPRGVPGLIYPGRAIVAITIAMISIVVVILIILSLPAIESMAATQNSIVKSSEIPGMWRNISKTDIIAIIRGLRLL